MEYIFNTDDFEPAKRFAAWREAICDFYVPVDVQATRPEAYKGFIREAKFGDLGLTDILVSEQRIDRPLQRRPAAQNAPQAVPQSVAQPDAATAPPRRVSTGNLAIQQEDPADDAKPALKIDSYAAFIDQHGVTGLLDQLEAAAVYVIHAEGRPHFSRPQLMRMLDRLDLGPDFSREDGMRGFGTLLRQGKIGKIRRGQFSVLETSRFVPEASKLAR